MEGNDIERADAPLAFSAEAQAKIEALRKRYPTNQAALIPVLFVAQRDFGYLSAPALELVAQTLELPVTKVISTATFYTMLNKQPVGRHHVQVCKNISCYLRGSDEVTAAFEAAMGIECGDTTKDGCFTLSEVECLAACGRAPVVQVNETYHEWVTPEQATALVETLRNAPKD